MSYTFAEAVKAVGMNKTSILRAIKSGRITGTSGLDNGTSSLRSFTAFTQPLQSSTASPMQRNDTQ